MKRSPERRGLVLGFGLAALLLGGLCFSSYQNASQLIESTNKSKQTYTVIQDLMHIFALMTVAESGRRGYLFLGNTSELVRYRQAVQEMEPALQMLRRDIADAPQQMRQMVRLETLLNQRIDLLDQSITLRQRTAKNTVPLPPQQAVITHESIQLRTEIQQVIADMQLEEERLLQQWLQQSQQSIQNRLLIEGLVAASILATLITVYVLLERQMTRRQQAERRQTHLQQERELNELQLRLFSMVSHEFRTPLTVILGSAQLLTTQLAPDGSTHLPRDPSPTLPPDRLKKSLNRIQSSAQRMTELLNHLLLVSRAEVGKLEFTPKLVDVEAFCLNLIEDLQVSAAGRSLKFVSQGTCGYAQLDDKLLYSILSNLLSNAIKYSDPPSVIELRLQCQPTATTFVVTDQGRGIGPEDLPHVFDLFHRGQNAGDTAGSGLGLAAVKKCVDLHGGEITVESQVGEGTRFRVGIPVRRSRGGDRPLP
jgi:signal transduction histidine kinase